jgi:phosphatidylglycerophosphatase A
MQIFLWISTLGGIGYLPVSSILAMALGVFWMYFVQKRTGYWQVLLVIQIILGVIFITLSPSEGAEDPSVFVLDEFVTAGILLLASQRWTFLLLGLALYGTTDTVRPLAQYSQSLPVGLGVAGDDIVSAILAMLAMLLLRQTVVNYRASNKIKE